MFPSEIAIELVLMVAEVHQLSAFVDGVLDDDVGHHGSEVGLVSLVYFSVQQLLANGYLLEGRTTHFSRISNQLY